MNGQHTTKKKRSRGKPHIYFDCLRDEWMYRGNHCSDCAGFCDMMDSRTMAGK